MKTQEPREQNTKSPRVSLEQKLRCLAQKFYAADRHRKKSETQRHCRSRFPRSRDWGLIAAFLGLVALSSVAHASTPVQTFDEANRTFTSGNYPAAINQYEAIVAHQGYSAPLLFNLGNACYRNGDLGKAILNYERAQALAPHDTEIAANLRLARQKASVQALPLGEVEKAANLVTPNRLAWCGSIALAAICLGIGVTRVRPTFSKSKAVTGVAVVALLVVATAFAVRWPEFDRAIIVPPTAPIRIAPANTAAESFALRGGESVSVVKAYGQFALVRTPDGRSGWVDEREIGRIFAASRDAKEM